MKKIISLFQRNYETDHLFRDEIVPGAEWVLKGEGYATRKFDGTCCMIKNKKLYKRYDVKKGRKTPKDFIPAQDHDKITGHWPGWIPIKKCPEDRWHREAFKGNEIDGTYELCGPKIQGNPEKLKEHILIPHGKEIIKDCPRTFEKIRDWLKNQDIEGIVWYHPDGHRVKIKLIDFGLKRKS